MNDVVIPPVVPHRYNLSFSDDISRDGHEKNAICYFSDQSIQVSRIDFPKPQQPLILIGGVFETKIYQLVIFLQTLDLLMLNHNGHHNVIKAHNMIPYSILVISFEVVSEKKCL
jgi:hypothetical protein